jgi:hypothetical protein
MSTLRELCALLSTHADSINDWSIGGQIFEQYVMLIDRRDAYIKGTFIFVFV